MNFDPQKFFIGLMDFFSILLPGALLTYLLMDEVAPVMLVMLGDRYFKLVGAQAWAAFLFASYLFGHLVFLLGSWLDELYDRARRHTLNAQIALLARRGRLLSWIARALIWLVYQINSNRQRSHSHAPSNPRPPRADEAEQRRHFQQLSHKPVDPRVRPVVRQLRGRHAGWAGARRMDPEHRCQCDQSAVQPRQPANRAALLRVSGAGEPVTRATDPNVRLEAVATAIVELNPPPTEFNTSDLHLEIKQGTQLVAYERLDFNVKVEPNAPISNNPLTYINVDPPAVVLTLPDPGVALDPNAAFVELPPDGTPPKFVPLRDAINKVLAQDPNAGATLANRSPLTAAQSRQVAREIIWNRQIAPPPERPNNRPLEDMYTRPPTDTSMSNDDRDQRATPSMLTKWPAGSRHARSTVRQQQHN